MRRTLRDRSLVTVTRHNRASPFWRTILARAREITTTTAKSTPLTTLRGEKAINCKTKPYRPALTPPQITRPGGSTMELRPQGQAQVWVPELLYRSQARLCWALFRD